MSTAKTNMEKKTTTSVPSVIPPRMPGQLRSGEFIQDRLTAVQRHNLEQQVLDARVETCKNARGLGASEETICSLSTNELRDWIRDRRNHYFIVTYIEEKGKTIRYRDSVTKVRMKVGDIVFVPLNRVTIGKVSFTWDMQDYVRNEKRTISGKTRWFSESWEVIKMQISEIEDDNMVLRVAPTLPKLKGFSFAVDKTRVAQDFEKALPEEAKEKKRKLVPPGPRKSAKKQNIEMFPLLDNDENKAKLLSLLIIFAQIFGLSQKKMEPHLEMKIHEMEIAMDVNDDTEAKATELAQSAFDSIYDPNKMLVYCETEKLFPRLRTYYKTYMNISDGAVEKFMDECRKNFDACQAYEASVDLVRLEINQNFLCEHEKEAFAEKIKEMDALQKGWRTNALKDWRVKEAQRHKKGAN